MKEAEALIAKAGRFLATAEKTLELGDYDSCASRCNYAMFFVAEALLLTKGLTASSHKGVISLFGKHFVKAGILEKELGKALSEAHDKRLLADYGVGFGIREEEAKELLGIAAEFVESVRRHLMEERDEPRPRDH